MGSLLSRSSSVRPERSKSRWRKGKPKGKRFQRMEPTTEDDNIQNNNEHGSSNGNLINSHEEWKKRIEQQQQQQLANMNGDPPGAPSTYPSSFPMMQNDLMTQSWVSHHDANNQYYPGTLHSMATSTNMSYDPNQYGQTQIPNTFINQSQQVMLDDRPSKKVQFARPVEQRSSFKNPLTATQSCHEINPNSTDVSTSTTRPEPIISGQSVHRPIVPKNAVSLAQIPIEKPIYVGIDHRATLAERGQTTAHKHHHKNNPDNTNNHRTRSHTHQHKHQESSDSSTPRNTLPAIRSFDPAQMTRTLTTTSTSTIIPSKSVPHIDQSIYNDNEMKIPRNRSNRQHIERQAVVNNDTKTSRSRSNHSQPREQQQQQQQQQQRTTINRNNSPLRTEIVRRSENKQQGTPVLRIPISQSQSQQRQKQSTMPSTTITTTNLTRARV